MQGFIIISLLWGFLTLIYGILNSQYYVENLPGLSGSTLVKIHSGHISVNENKDKFLFFIFFSNKYITDKQRTLIWLNGGPGCSSMDGAFLENGPLKIVGKDTFMENQGGWNEFSNFLVVDQPAGTGFSYDLSGNIIHGISDMLTDFIVFLDAFFELFPQYKNDDLYISGESYAGQYIPYIATEILKRNKNENESKNYNLKGILMGNAWIDPLIQYRSYLPFALKNGLVKQGSMLEKEVEKSIKLCEEAFETNKTDHSSICSNILRLIISPQTRDDRKCINMYDYRLTSSSCEEPWPKESVFLKSYLKKPDVIKALNIDSSKNIVWKECNPNILDMFLAHESLPSIYLLPALLEKIQVLLYNGDKDIICNHLGTEDMINNMEWNGRKGFRKEDGTWATRYKWVFMDRHVGYYQYDRNLTYVLIKDASHMVPYDKPLESQDMLNRFLGIDPEVIEKVRKSNFAANTNVGSVVNVNENLLKVKHISLWSLYYYICAVVLLVLIIITIWLAWRFHTSYKKLQNSYFVKYNDSPNNNYANENGLNHKESSNSPYFNSDLYNPNPYSETLYSSRSYSQPGQSPHPSDSNYKNRDPNYS